MSHPTDLFKLYSVKALWLCTSLLPALAQALATPTPNALTDPYDILSYTANQNVGVFNHNSKELDLKLAFERALVFATQEPEWLPAVRLAVDTLKTSASRAAYAASLPAKIQTALRLGDSAALLATIRRLHQTPGGDAILLALTQKSPGLDYDYIRSQLDDDAASQQVINYLNQTLFGYE